MDKKDCLQRFVGKRILVTGGNGYLATNLIQELMNVPCHISRFGRKGIQWVELTRPSPATVENIEGDIRNVSDWSDVLSDAEYVFHFAAQTSVYFSNSKPIDDLEVNVMPVLRMLEVCRKRNCKPAFIFAGTVTELGIPSGLPVDETQRDDPITIYDIHKLSSEHYIRWYSSMGIISGVVLRLTNVYGPGPRSSSADRGILNRMIVKALNGEPITVYGEGSFVRDYIYISDVIKAFIAAASNIKGIAGSHFVIGSGQGITIADAFTKVAQRASVKTGKLVPIQKVPMPAGLSLIETRNFVADTRLFRQLTGWTPDIQFVQGIDLTIESYAEELA